jgi:hypothetical protein
MMDTTTSIQKGIWECPLAVEELALALGLINRPDLGRTILSSAYDKLTEQQANERLTTASHTLLTKGLCSLSKEGQPLLDKMFEEALFPLARFDYLLQVSTIQKDIQRSMVINIIKNRAFTSHFIQKGIIHTLAYGKFEQLADYLLHFLGDLDKDASKSPKLLIKIRMGTLGRAAEKKQTEGQVTTLLLEDGWPETQAKMLAEDLLHQTSHSTIMRINVTSETKPETIKDSSKPTLLILKGAVRGWVFEFSSPDDQVVGTARIGDRDMLGKVLISFIT